MLRVAVLIKQVPAVESLALGPDGRLVRTGAPLEINAYCRRAISQGVRLARDSGGRCTVFTLGPPSAEDALREAVAWGADEGVLVTDAAFAGSDTLATARALAAAIELLGPFDLILTGRNSVDADTGQVGPEVAELLGLPFLAGVKALAVKALAVTSATAVARLELDDGWADAEVDLPALLSCAERLCEPAKVDPAGRAGVDPGRLRRLSATDLGPGPWGEAASPTRVGGVRTLEVARRRLVLSGPLPEQVAELVALLGDAGALDRDAPGGARSDMVRDDWRRGEKGVAVLLERARATEARQLLGAAARVAHAVSGHVIALAEAGIADAALVGSWGADELVELRAPGDTGPPLAEEDLHPDGGDDTRSWGPPWSDGQSTYFQAVNRNKISVACDLRKDVDRAAAWELCSQADVVVENFKAGTMERRGLGPEQVLEQNPGAIYCSISGFGTGAGKDLLGYDFLVQAVGGLMSVTGETDGDPMKVGVAIVDVITGLHALSGILAALHHRSATGNGQHIEVNLMSSLLSALVNQVSSYLNTGTVPAAMGNVHPSIVPYELMEAADRPLALAVGNDLQFRALCAELGLVSLVEDERFATNDVRVRNREALMAELGAVLATAPAQLWIDRLSSVGVPCGLVNHIDEAVAMARRLGLEPAVDIERPDGTTSRQVRHPISFATTPAQYRLAPPQWGEVKAAGDIASLLAALGRS